MGLTREEWGMRVGINGVLDLYFNHDLELNIYTTADEIIKLMVEHKVWPGWRTWSERLTCPRV